MYLPGFCLRDERGFLFIRQSISLPHISQLTAVISFSFQDQNGYICSKELGALLRTLGCNPTEAEVNTLMASIDVDHNGKIDLLEFIVMMHQTVGRTDTMEEIRMAFRFAFSK